MIFYHDFQNIGYGRVYLNHGDGKSAIEGSDSNETDVTIPFPIWGKNYVLRLSEQEERVLLYQEDGSLFPYLPHGAEDIDFHPFRMWGKEYLCYTEGGKKYLIDEHGKQVLPYGVDDIEGTGRGHIGMETFLSLLDRELFLPLPHDMIKCYVEGEVLFCSQDGRMFTFGRKGTMQEQQPSGQETKDRMFFGEACKIVPNREGNGWYVQFTKDGTLLPVGEPATSPFFATLLIPQMDGTRKEYLIFERHGLFFETDRDGHLLHPQGSLSLPKPSLWSYIKDTVHEIKALLTLDLYD